jgi:hypothetical protein
VIAALLSTQTPAASDHSINHEPPAMDQRWQAMARFWRWQRHNRGLETRAGAPPMNIPKIALLVVIGIMILVASFYLSLTILTLLD